MISTTHHPATGKVVPMDLFRDRTGLSPLRRAEAYWCALREGASVPNRSQIDPRGLEDILGQTFILERIAPGIARFRLAGSHFNDLAGMEVRGMPLTMFFTPAGRAGISAVLEQVFDAPAVAELSLSTRPAGRLQPARARMLLLPLRGDNGAVSRILGVLVTDLPAHAARPVRFDIDDTGLRPVEGARAENSSLSPEMAQDGLAEDQAPLNGPVPHLRLVK